MYVRLCEHTGNPLQSRFKTFQILTSTMPVIVPSYQLLSCCQSTYFVLHHHFQWSHCSVYMLHTGPPLPDVLLAWPQHQGRELCMCTVHTAWSTLHGAMAHISSVTPPLLEAVPTHHCWPSLVTLDSFLQRGGCHLMTLLMSFCYFCQCQRIHLDLYIYFSSNHLSKNSGGPFSEGDTSVWQCVVSATCSTVLTTI